MKKLILALLILSSCSTPSEESDTSNDRDFNLLIGKRTTIEGVASNTKIGALVIINEDTSIWVDELESWPPEYHADGDNGKIVRVTGTIIERYDLPVQIKRASKPQGPEKPGLIATDTEETTHRYLIKNATWELVSYN